MEAEEKLSDLARLVSGVLSDTEEEIKFRPAPKDNLSPTKLQEQQEAERLLAPPPQRD
ncbi:MAG: hypothetical protein Q7Q71_06205 [Verrucomicrobiota bacterium JB023]|nr:hypothetical protein [Verrucomicrobiota bacterium JB023]